MSFLIPGILAQSILFISIFYGIAIIWERDLGLVHKFLATPAPRIALVMGKAISAGFRSLPLVFILYLLGILLGIRFNWNPLNLFGVLFMVVLGAIFFSNFSLIIACIVKTRERFMGIGQLLTMPLFFASNAIYPLTMMPPWLRVISRVNPLTEVINALRYLMIPSGNATDLWVDYGVVAGASFLLMLLGSWIYPRVIR